MIDLFGMEITRPHVRVKRESNACEGFAEFWAAWPKSPRKVAKQQCLDKWSRYDCADSWKHIVAHVEWMKTQPDWVKDNGSYICAPLVYLNQRRWVDWEPPAPKEPPKPVKQAADNPAPMPENVRAMLAKLKGRG